MREVLEKQRYTFVLEKEEEKIITLEQLLEVRLINRHWFAVEMDKEREKRKRNFNILFKKIREKG